MDDETKQKLMLMSNKERIDFLNHVLDTDELRFKLIEIADIRKRLKELEASIKPHKISLTETMKAASLGEFEIADGLSINLRKGSRYYRISYKDIEKSYPHLLAEMEDIVKITKTGDTYTTKYREE